MSPRKRLTDEGFLVLAGSTAAPEFKAGNPGYERLREKLLRNGTLRDEKERLVLTRDYLADSSTQAASVIAGGNRSEPGSWKSGGKFLGELESAAVAAPESGIIHP